MRNLNIGQVLAVCGKTQELQILKISRMAVVVLSCITIKHGKTRNEQECPEFSQCSSNICGITYKHEPRDGHMSFINHDYLPQKHVGSMRWLASNIYRFPTK